MLVTEYTLSKRLISGTKANMAFYCCPYILRTGEICNKGCYRPEGCKIHWKAPTRVPCKECGKLTYSGYDYCDTHADKYRRRDRYQQKKLEKMAQGGSGVKEN